MKITGTLTVDGHRFAATADNEGQVRILLQRAWHQHVRETGGRSWRWCDVADDVQFTRKR